MLTTPLPLTLRPYQTDALNRVRSIIARGGCSPLLVAPTGSGKTVIAAAIVRGAFEKGNVVYFVAPRRELIDQTCEKLDHAGLAGCYGVVMGSDKRRYSMARVQVCSIDTLRARMGQTTLRANPRVVVIDEAHLYTTQKRMETLGQWGDVIRLGLTATPCRFDGVGLGKLFDELIEVATVAELTEMGHLVPARYFSLSDPDLRRVGIRLGDYALDELAEVMGGAKLIGDTVREWQQRAANKRTAVFAVNRAHSVLLCEAFKAEGIRAEHVDGSMPTYERDAIINRFRNGTTQVLTNCQIVQYGFDLPELDCCVLARPTRSLSLYLQMLGRGLRPAKDKTELLVLDHSGAVRRHGFADDAREWSLDGIDVKAEREKQEQRLVEERIITCEKCGCTYSKRPACPSCGHFHTVRAKGVPMLQGELIEIRKTGPSDDEKRGWFAQLLGYCEIKGYSPGWAYHQYRHKFGENPPRNIRAMQPGEAMMRWLKYRQIAYAKRRQA